MERSRVIVGLREAGPVESRHPEICGSDEKRVRTRCVTTALMGLGPQPPAYSSDSARAIVASRPSALSIRYVVVAVAPHQGIADPPSLVADEPVG